MKLDIEDWKQDFGKPAFPRKVLTLDGLKAIRKIIEAWGDDPVTLTGDVLQRHIDFKLAHTHHGSKTVHVGLLMSRMLEEIDELHEMLEIARTDYKREKRMNYGTV